MLSGLSSSQARRGSRMTCKMEKRWESQDVNFQVDMTGLDDDHFASLIRLLLTIPYNF